MNTLAFRLLPLHVLILSILERGGGFGHADLLKQIVGWLEYADEREIAAEFQTTKAAPGYGMAKLVTECLQSFALSDQTLREFREACSDLAYLDLISDGHSAATITEAGKSVVGNMAIAGRATYKELFR